MSRARKYQRDWHISSLGTFINLWESGQRWFWLEHATHSQTIHGAVLRNMSVQVVQRFIDRGVLYTAKQDKEATT